MKTSNKELLLTLWDIVMHGKSSNSPPTSLRSDPMVSKLMADCSNKSLDPIKYLPDVRTFKVKVGPYHPVLEKEGINKREFTPEFEIEKYKNRSINRYVKHQIQRLHQNINNTPKFWAISSQLMSSTSYLVICYNAVFPRWEKELSYKKVWSTIQKVIHLNLNNYNYKIVGIPKNKDELRYLGVPTPAWRVYLHAWNNILLIWLHAFIPESQHGFYPKRGSLSAWDVIYKEVLTSPNIYEFDLRKFFDSINLKHLKTLLQKLEVEPHLVKLIMRINQSPPKKGTCSQVWSTDRAEIIKYHETGQWGIDNDIERMYWINYGKEDASYYVGVAQGSPLSPLLSSIMLIPHLLLHKDYDIIQYADDGIIYNYDKLPELNFPPETGMKIHPEKSQIIKSEGIWKNKLKFLGQRYVHQSLLPNQEIPSDLSCIHEGVVYNATRIPKAFGLSKLDIFREALKHDMKLSSPGLLKEPQLSLNQIMNSAYKGYLQSRLYLGTWDILDLQLDFTFHWEPNSWTELKEKQPYINGELIKNPISLHNVSSYATQSLARRIDYSYNGRKMAVPWKRLEIALSC